MDPNPIDPRFRFESVSSSEEELPVNQPVKQPVKLGNVNNIVQTHDEIAKRDKSITIAKIAVPIIIATIFFTGIPFVSGIGVPVGLALTGLFLITVGSYYMLKGKGLEMFKGWAEEPKLDSEKAADDKNSKKQPPVSDVSPETIPKKAADERNNKKLLTLPGVDESSETSTLTETSEDSIL